MLPDLLCYQLFFNKALLKYFFCHEDTKTRSKEKLKIKIFVPSWQKFITVVLRQVIFFRQDQ